jgi:O-succinylbenzoic acid--CoA ligase
MAKSDLKIITQEYGTIFIKDFVNSTISTPSFLVDAQKIIKFLVSKESFITVSTSGSTSKPKQIALKKSDLLKSAKSTANFLGLEKSTSKKILVALNSNKIAGIMQIVRAYFLNFDLILINPSNTPLENDWLTQFDGFSLLSLVPHQLHFALEKKLSLEIIQKCENILIGGAPVSESLKAEVKKIKKSVRIFETFGMTETVSHFALKELHPNESPYFKTLPGVKIKTDKQGKLMIKSKINQNKWLLTDDYIKLIDSNSFTWLGRSINVINSGGVKLFSEQLEADLVLKCKELQNKKIVIVPFYDSIYGQIPCLVIEGTKDQSLIQKINNLEFDKYCRPQKIIFIPEIPMINFKPDRKKIIEQIMPNVQTLDSN